MSDRSDNLWNLRNKKLTRAAFAVLCFFVAAAIVLGLLVGYNRFWIELNMSGSETVTLEYDQSFKDGGATARLKASVLKFMERELDVKTEGEVVQDKTGTYELIYSAEFGEIREEMKRTVNIVDTKAPHIELTADPDAYTLPGHEYQEEGFKASDDYDGDLTDKVVRTEKDGIVYYSVTDSSGNKAEATRTIVYDDRTAPVLEIGASNISLVEGEKWEDTFSAVDDLDGDITDKVIVEGSVDTSKPGRYELKYSATDSYGNKAEASRTVDVFTNTEDVYAMAAAGEKVVFLTFDDGPDQYTEELLNTLAENNVKATFFVTAQEPDYLDLIGRAHSEGHSIGVHTFTHDYAEIYQSGRTFWDDIEAMNDIVEEQTGSRADFFRFAGGSSNTVSESYNNTQGIMERLAEQAEKKGYDFFDWNVDSFDAGGATTSEEVRDNVIAGVEELDISVVLMHDIHDYTVKAIPEILQYGKEHGWRFLTLKKGIYTCHHDINNKEPVEETPEAEAEKEEQDVEPVN